MYTPECCKHEVFRKTRVLNKFGEIEIMGEFYSTLILMRYSNRTGLTIILDNGGTNTPDKSDPYGLDLRSSLSLVGFVPPRELAMKLSCSLFNRIFSKRNTLSAYFLSLIARPHSSVWPVTLVLFATSVATLKNVLHRPYQLK